MMTAVTDTKSIAWLAPNPHQHPQFDEARARRHTNDSGGANFERSITTYVTEVFANDVAGCAKLIIHEGRGHEAHGRQDEVLVVK